jgi:hypothetical protein
VEAFSRQRGLNVGIGVDPAKSFGDRVEGGGGHRGSLWPARAKA